MEGQNEFIQKFGYAEMYEWANPSIVKERLGIFVQFDNEFPNKIKPFDDSTSKGLPIVGVTTINSTIISDNPEQWKYMNAFNEVGDLYLRKEKLAVGQKVYDEILEMNYIVTRPWEHFISVQNEIYDPQKQYIPRTSRPEWVKVNLIGKCIVRDNGKCIPGEFCQPYDGNLRNEFGKAIPAKPSYKGETYYVLERVSDTTILILLK